MPKPADQRAARPNSPETAPSSGFGQRLRRARLDQDRTLRDISERSGISITYLSDLERGVLVNPTLDTLKKVAEALDVSLNDLLGIDEHESAPSYPKALEEFLLSEHFRQALTEQTKRERVTPEELEDDWRRALAGIRVRGRTPRQASDYLFIFEAIRRALERS
jgi:transcriptional regulator with XRE-family HTH domain